MNVAPPSPAEEQLIDEAAAESFPASDAPAYSSMHAGAPAPRPWTRATANEVRSQLRADLERLSRRFAGPREMLVAREELVAHTMLEAGRAVVREPIDSALGIRNVESELEGNRGPCLIVAARYDLDDVSRIAMLLALVRALASARFRAPARFVALAGASPSAAGGARYFERLERSGAAVLAVLSLSRLALARDRPARTFFSGGLRSWSTVKTAKKAFRQVSRIQARAICVPSWWPGPHAFGKGARRQHWPLVAVADGVPWRVGTRIDPDVDRMAAALPGLVAVVDRLAGGTA